MGEDVVEDRRDISNRVHQLRIQEFSRRLRKFCGWIERWSWTREEAEPREKRRGDWNCWFFQDKQSLQDRPSLQEWSLPWLMLHLCDSMGRSDVRHASLAPNTWANKEHSRNGHSSCHKLASYLRDIWDTWKGLDLYIRTKWEIAKAQQSEN